MKYVVIILSLLWCISSAQAMQLNEELAYRVRFSKAGDVTLLLDKGADPNAVNVTGLPMVSVAASRKDSDAVAVLRALVDAGADVNKGGVNNQYPIIIAAREDNVAMVKYLVDETNVNVTVRDLNGLLPMEIAEYYGSVHVAELLTSHTQRRIDEERERVSPQRRDTIVRDLANHYCEHAYMHYYHKSGQSGLSKKEANAVIMDYRLKGKEMIDELYTTFKVPVELALEMKESIGKPMKAELDAMISNRERRRRGIGTEGDLKARCGKYAGDWIAQYERRQAASAARME